MVKENKCSINIQDQLLLQHELKQLDELKESRTKYRRVVQGRHCPVDQRLPGWTDLV